MPINEVFVFWTIVIALIVALPLLELDPILSPVLCRGGSFFCEEGSELEQKMHRFMTSDDYSKLYKQSKIFSAILPVVFTLLSFGLRLIAPWDNESVLFVSFLITFILGFFSSQKLEDEIEQAKKKYGLVP